MKGCAVSRALDFFDRSEGKWEVPADVEASIVGFGFDGKRY